MLRVVLFLNVHKVLLGSNVLDLNYTSLSTIIIFQKTAICHAYLEAKVEAKVILFFMTKNTINLFLHPKKRVTLQFSSFLM